MILSEQMTTRTSWVVLKFGGTSVSSAECWETIAKILRERISDGLRPLVVCSALSQVSNQLEAALARALDGGDPSRFVSELAERHRSFAAQLGVELGKDAEAEIARLADQLTGISIIREASPRLQAEVLAVGEMLSTRIGARWLDAQGLSTRWLDARTLLNAEARPDDAHRQYLSATCAEGGDPELADRLADHPEAVLLTQGFLVAGPDGETALLGRGGSDTSATYLGERLAARHVEIWTDVPGLFTADPRVVPNAQRLAWIGFEEVMELTTRGAKVLHPRSVAPARRAGLPIHIRCTRDPSSEGTIIADGLGSDQPSALAIASRHGMAVIAMDVETSWQEVGVIAQLAACFAQHGLSIDSITSSQARVTVSLDPSANALDDEKLSALMADLEQYSRPQIISPVASVSIVGTHLRRVLHDLPSLFQKLADHDVYLLAHAANDHSLTFVVDQGRVDAIIRELHGDLERGPTPEQVAQESGAVPASRTADSSDSRI
jgi:diaminopimelate decarboxylase/aspartate kinase